MKCNFPDTVTVSNTQTHVHTYTTFFGINVYKCCAAKKSYLILDTVISDSQRK